jgi:hypothetical protein
VQDSIPRIHEIAQSGITSGYPLHKPPYKPMQSTRANP